LVWFFLFDSVFTFLKRLLRGEKVWRAHREHIYQKLVISGVTHAKVTSLYALLSVILVTVLVSTLKFSLSFEKTVFGVIVLETILLILFWQKIVGSAKKRGRLE
jgi:phosphate/sulfate permease